MAWLSAIKMRGRVRACVYECVRVSLHCKKTKKREEGVFFSKMPRNENSSKKYHSFSLLRVCNDDDKLLRYIGV